MQELDQKILKSLTLLSRCYDGVGIVISLKLSRYLYRICSSAFSLNYRDKSDNAIKYLGLTEKVRFKKDLSLR